MERCFCIFKEIIEAIYQFAFNVKMQDFTASLNRNMFLIFFSFLSFDVLNCHSQLGRDSAVEIQKLIKIFMSSLKIRLTRTYKEVCRELTKERLESLEKIEVSSVLMTKLGYIIYEDAICLQRRVELIKRWRIMRQMIKTIGKKRSLHFL